MGLLCEVASRFVVASIVEPSSLVKPGGCVACVPIWCLSPPWVPSKCGSDLRIQLVKRILVDDLQPIIACPFGNQSAEPNLAAPHMLADFPSGSGQWVSPPPFLVSLVGWLRQRREWFCSYSSQDTIHFL